MHEMALMAGVFDIIRQHTVGYDDKKVLNVTLVIGEMTNAIPAALQAAFAAYAGGTNVAGARLIIRGVPLTAKCAECSWEGPIEKYSFICPVCFSLSIEIKSGRELYVESLEVE